MTRVGIVTGATSGIGRGVALAMARRGHLVVGLGRDPGRLDALRADLAAEGPGPAHRALRLDVSREGDMTALGEALDGIGRADLLVCSAFVGRGLGGRALPPPTAELPLADWQAMVDVNLHGVFLANRAVLPLMLAQGEGDIVNVGSSTTPRGLRGTALAPAYAATKFALAEFGRALGEEVRPDGVRVVTVFPGPVTTPLIQDTLLAGPFGGSMTERGFAEALLGLLDLGRDLDVATPHVLPVPTRRKASRRG